MAIIYGTFDTNTHNNALLRDIRSLGFPNMENGPWIAGGAVRRILTGEERGGDIDIFVNSPKSYDRVIKSIFGRGDFSKNGNETENNAFYECVIEFRSGLRKVQIIKNRMFGTAEDLIMDFDLTVCMAATDGWNWIADEQFMRDIDSKELVLNNADQRDKNTIRLAKYCKYGFTPVPGVFANMIGLTNGNINNTLSDSGVMVVKSDQY